MYTKILIMLWGPNKSEWADLTPKRVNADFQSEFLCTRKATIYTSSCQNLSIFYLISYRMQIVFRAQQRQIVLIRGVTSLKMSIVVHTNTLNSLLLIENSSCHIKVEISARVNYVCMHTHSKKNTNSWTRSRFRIRRKTERKCNHLLSLC